MTIYEQLLVVQEHDTRLDQLAHRRSGLPERERIAEADQVLATLDGRIATQSEVVAEARRAQRRLEDELAVQEQRATQIEGRLYDGSVSAVRELQDMQGELDTVRNHISHLEDQGLAALERVETEQAALADLESMRAQVVDRREDAEMALTAAAAEIDVEVDAQTTARREAIAGIPDDVVAEYERLRRVMDGVAIARLSGNRCEGCHLALSAVEMDRIRRLDPNQTVHCEECGRLLVH